MRKILLSGLLFAALFVGCENKTPAGPDGVTITTSTSSTTTSITTSTTSTTTSTTTTTVPTSAARRYVAFNPPANVPADMTLFFELIVSSAGLSALLDGFSAATENEYRITGVYAMKNGTTGDVRGTLGGALNPLETGGTFRGTLTAKMSSGCVAEREYGGRLTSQTLSWDGGATLRNCAENPLAFGSFTLLVSGVTLPTTVAFTSTDAGASFDAAPAPANALASLNERQ